MSPNAMVEVYVKPGVRTPKVGGEFDGRLIVAVSAPASDGQANEAVCTALAQALGLASRAVRLQAGASSRRKRFSLTLADPQQREEVERRLVQLRRG